MAAVTSCCSATSDVLRRSLLCLLLLLCCHGSDAQLGGAAGGWGSSRRGAPTECRFDRLEPLEPQMKVQSEAGFVEYFEQYEESNEQLCCAGVLPIRLVVEPLGLLLPRYTNGHAIVYILQGRGIVEFSFPGCKLYLEKTCHHHQQQFFQQTSAEAEARLRVVDEHQNQKIHRFRQGDVVAMPAGAQHWLYNDGDEPVVAVYVFDTSNGINQLEPMMRKFLLAGSFNEGQRHYAESIFKGLDVELLSEALGVSADLARKLQSQNDGRGEIVHAEHGLQLLRPDECSFSQQQEPHQQCPRDLRQNNVLDDSSDICTMEVRQNIENPDRADIYNPRVGRITRLNSQKFPILNLIQMSAVRVDLYQDAILSPFWNSNAHSVMYTIQGSARVQVVNDNGTAVFDGVLHRGQLLIIPQNYVVAEKAEGEGFQYISFKTNPNSLVSHIAGKDSVLGDLPVDVIARSYSISREEATELKNNRRHELGVFAPRYQQKSIRGHGGRAQE